MLQVCNEAFDSQKRKKEKNVMKPQFLLFLYYLCDVQNNKLYGIQSKY